MKRDSEQEFGYGELCQEDYWIRLVEAITK